MRYVYLKNSKEKLGQACRGGVSANYGDCEYELEIGNYKNCSVEMLSLCSLHDEIIEFLEKSDSLLGALVLSEYNKQCKEIREKLIQEQCSEDT